MRNTLSMVPFPTIIFCLLLTASPLVSIAADLDWITSKEEAFSLAEQQGKKVLLVAGSDT